MGQDRGRGGTTAQYGVPSANVHNTLITLALIVAVVCVPTVAGLTAWGLAGGDGEQKNVFIGLLAMVLGFGSIYTAATCYSAYFADLPQWRWWLMFLPPAAGIIGVLLHREELRGSETSEGLLVIGMQLVLAIPAMLLLAGDAVTLG